MKYNIVCCARIRVSRDYWLRAINKIFSIYIQIRMDCTIAHIQAEHSVRAAAAATGATAAAVCKRIQMYTAHP